jgi:threonine synthase
MALLAETSGVFGETAAGVTLGALREAVLRDEVGADDRVVLLVTGDGLKTPDPVAARLQPIEIEADADALLDRLGVAIGASRSKARVEVAPGHESLAAVLPVR